MKLTKVSTAGFLALCAAQFLGVSEGRAQNVLVFTDILHLLVGETAYARGTGANGDTWDEILSGPAGSGTVTDYKQGPGDPRDPSTQVGSYFINSDNNTIQYTYPKAAPFTYTITSQGEQSPYTYGLYTFASTQQTLNITVSSAPCEPHRH